MATVDDTLLSSVASSFHSLFCVVFCLLGCVCTGLFCFCVSLVDDLFAWFSWLLLAMLFDCCMSCYFPFLLLMASPPVTVARLLLCCLYGGTNFGIF